MGIAKRLNMEVVEGRRNKDDAERLVRKILTRKEKQLSLFTPAGLNQRKEGKGCLGLGNP